MPFRPPPTIVLLLAGVLLAASPVAAQETGVYKIRDNGSSANRVDFVILGDGYTASEISSGKYAQDVENFLAQMFAQQPYLEYAPFFNVFRIDVVSNESGADHPNRTPPVYRDTALDAAYNCSGIQRLICANVTKVNAIVTRNLPAEARDMILVLVNDPEYGGSGGSFAVASTNVSVTELVLHETGHSFGLLADEYEYGPPACNATYEPSSANATKQTSRDLIKWTVWIDPSTPIPTSTTAPGVPGLYAGAVYCPSELYRSTYNSKMRSLGAPFDQINTEQILKRIYNLVSPIDGYAPATNYVDLANASRLFSVSVPQPASHSLSIAWTFDGALVGTGPEYTLSASAGAAGMPHNLAVVVTDSTALVRNDPSHVLSESWTWTVTGFAGKVATTTTVTSSANPSLLGQAVTFTATVTSGAGGMPTGVVSWQDGGASVAGCGAIALNGSAQARCTATLAAGVHSITASYGGDAAFQPSVSSGLVQTVLAPAIVTTSPPRARPGSGALTLTVSGANFVSGSTVLWNGLPRTTTFVNSTELRAAVTADDVAVKGAVQVSVCYPAPGNATSSSFTFVVGAIGPDFNGDGSPDIVWRNRVTGEITIWLMGGLTVGSEVRLDGPADREWRIVAIGDFNQDGDVDLLWRNATTGENQIWYMAGTTHAGTGAVPTVADAAWKIAGAADFDADGKPDIVWRNTATGQNLVWYMNGAAYRWYAWLPQVAEARWQIAAVDDFDGDGAPDLLWRDQAGGQSLIWDMDAAAYTGYAWLDAIGVRWRVGMTGDFDGDGKADIVWRDTTTGENRLDVMNGAACVRTDVLPGMTDADCDLLRSAEGVRSSEGDFNLDGSCDILWHNATTGESRVWYMTGATLVAEGTVATETDLGWRSVAVADFNGDGLPDIVWRNALTGANRIWLMTGRSHTGDMTLPTIADASWKIVGVGDFNRDGHPDLVWRNYATGANVIWFLHNGAYSDWTAPPTITDTTWQIVGVGDFNGDGWPDLMWRNQATGANIAWFLVSGVYSGWSAPPTITDTTWQIVGVADFNADGKADLLWRNATTGANLVWYLSNGTYIGWAALPSLDVAWKTGAGQ